MLKMLKSTDSNLSLNSPILIPYLKVTIIEARNLSYFSDRALEFQPYVLISTDKKSMHTEHKATVDSIIWNSLFEVPINQGDFLRLSLLDYGDIDKETALSNIFIDYKCYSNWNLKEEDLWIKICDNSYKKTTKRGKIATPYKIFTSRMIAKKPKTTRFPCLHIKLRYVDREALERFILKLELYNTVDIGVQKHIEYTGHITRGDGITRRIQLRYSQIRKLRDSLIDEFPHLRHLDFPQRSYISWLFPSECKFNQAILEERKDKLENFLNYFLQQYKYSAYLSALLQGFKN